jgi:ribA/ribD-fused uncharacterized protein
MNTRTTKRSESPESNAKMKASSISDPSEVASGTLMPPAAASSTVSNEQLFLLLQNLTEKLEDLTSKSATKSDVQGVSEAVRESLSAAVQKSEEAMKVAENAMKCANDYKDRCDFLQERLNRLEAYNRRENLIFEGIEESDHEICKDVIIKFFKDTLGIANAHNIMFQRVHRLPSKQKKIKPIICRFALYSDRQRVWAARGKLKNSAKFMREDFPHDYVLRRSKLYPYMMKARDLKKLSYLQDDRLIIGSNQYSVDTIGSIPKEFHPSEVPATKFIGDNIVAFFTKDSPLSNFHAASFILDRQRFLHVEQCLQYEKALTAERPDTAQQILSTVSPAECKRLGDKITIDQNEWLPRAKEIMYKACLAKFTENDEDRSFLMDTGDRKILEASKDRVWGVGLTMKSKFLGDQHKWSGRNETGQVLMAVRSKIKRDLEINSEDN